MVSILDYVVTCSYIVAMKQPRIKKKGLLYQMGTGPAVSVREAKAHFSSLVNRASDGEEITITRHGQVCARLVPVKADRPPLRIDRTWLRSQRLCPEEGLSERLVRTDRDGRG